MPHRVKLLFALLLALLSFVVVQAALLEIQYLPLARSGYPIIPTPTPTKTPVTPCLSLKTTGVCITAIDVDPYSGGPLNEFIRLQNVSSSSVDMKNWRISCDSGNKFDISFNFTLGVNSTVEIWTKPGTNDSDDLFMNRKEEFWHDHEDCAYVKNDEDPREQVDGICYGAEDGLGLFFFVPPITTP
jgi:hypothetical protein